MISPTDPDAVLGALGDKFLSALAGAVSAARVDIDEMRAWRPGWFPMMHSRCLSNLIHDRVWAHLVTAVEGDEGTTIIESGATREVQVGVNFLLRIKRHRTGDLISSYPTTGALAFYLQGASAFPGLELITLAGGYRWDDEERVIKAPVISYRDGKDNPIWAVELSEPQEGVATISWTPVPGPDLPSIQFEGELAGEEDQDTGTDDDE